MKKILGFLVVVGVIASTHILIANADQPQITTFIEVEYQKDTPIKEFKQLAFQKLSEQNEKIVKVQVLENILELPARKIGIQLKYSQNLENFYKQGNSLSNLFNKTQKAKIPLNILINEETLLNQINLNFTQIQPPVDPKFEYIEGEFIFVAGEEGHEVDTISILNKLKKDFETFNKLPNQITIPLVTINPSITDKEIQDKISHLQSFQNKTITLSHQDLSKSIILNITKSNIQSEAGKYYLNSETENEILTTINSELNTPKQDLVIKELNLSTGELVLEGNLQNGMSVNHDLLKQQVKLFLNSTQTETVIPLEISKQEGEIIDLTNSGLNFELLGQGKSNYVTSSYARKHNVEFAADSRYNSILIPQGEQFKFNSHLGGPITISRGWKNAYVIKGGEVVPGVGGGICQMSTTVYRAALNTGLQIDKQFNHSLYIDYYTAYGDGLDSTIYPGGKDLVFTNNTPGPIIMQSFHTEEDDLYVNMIGISDGRKVSMEGPFYRADRYEDPYNLNLRYNQIGWVRTVISQDGTKKIENYISKYAKYYKR